MTAGKLIRLFTLALLPATVPLCAQNRTNYPGLPPAAVQANPANSPASPPPQATPATLPPTAPTSDTDNTAPAPAAAPAPVQGPAHRATISYHDGQISVSASNSSLNQILRDISRQTGIKITGGVQDERVFGDYGPASPSQVLSTLLDGTGSNMLLVQGIDGRPSELVLTTRTGGPTPPNPNAIQNSDSDDDAPVRQIVNNPPEPPPPPSGSQSQPAPPAVATPIPPPTVDNSAPASATTTSSDSNQQSPNGVKTPQQIFDELMKLRQQQQQQH
ncbi:hypothetical protein [Edaphobacter flagellatus]|uniref:hypothetical protein n=1 Tax=Edaphobacter flagellatus TaxID=1933044 RepID=UPI0021B2FAE4|nr:hypothetical protein [Edaphobacter flagellatus]